MKKTLLIIGAVIVGLVVLMIASLAIVIILSGTRQETLPRETPAGIMPSEMAPAPTKSIAPTEEGMMAKKEDSAENETRLVIKSGLINMVVKNIDSAAENIIEYTESKGGWVVKSTVVEEKKIPSGEVTVRIPAKIFDESFAYFKGLAEKVTFEGTQGKDVTEEYTDLQSRLRNLEASEAQLLEIMKRSGKISEVLEVQKELTNVRSQIELIKGRMQYLEKSAEMATITINLALSEELLPIPPGEKWRPVYVAKLAWKSVVAALRGISYLLIWIVIYAIIWIPLVIVILLLRKLGKKRKETKKT